MAFAAALDSWAAVRRSRLSDRPGAERLAQVARVADPDPFRNRLRDALDSPDNRERRDALRALASSARDDELPPISLNLLGAALLVEGDPKTAENVLRPAHHRYPGDVWLTSNLALCLVRLGRREDAIRYYTAARSIRPETAHDLAHALEAKGEWDESIAVFRDLVRLRPGNGRHLTGLPGPGAPGVRSHSGGWCCTRFRNRGSATGCPPEAARCRRL